MAQDGYRGSPPAESASLHNYTDHPNDSSLHKTRSHQSTRSNNEYERVRPSEMTAAGSRESSYKQAQQPINDAVTSAFDKAEASHGISPELMTQITSQITANVIQQLKMTNLSAPVAAESRPSAPSSVGRSHSPANNSPPIPQRNVYTPPSPMRPTDDASPRSSYSQAKSTSNQSPVPDRHSPVSQASHRSESPAKRNSDRPKPSSVRLSFGQDATPVEKAWGSLYDDNGAPTARLGDFLRGIAIHLIEDYEPKQSLVVTPVKMQKFYHDSAIACELYPWQMVFDDRTSSISRLYREIGAQHHLVQEEGRLDGRPDIPGLTPRGFETWAMIVLHSNPEQEFERLQNVVRGMPISSAANRKERFPKEISRRLFPSERDTGARDRLEKAMITHCNITLPMKRPSEGDEARARRKTEAAVQQTAASTAPPGPTITHSTSSIERERQPYSGTASNASGAEEDDDDDDVPTPQPIERERKPYSAQPGGGKVYEDVNPTPTPSTQPPPPSDGLKDATARLRAGSSAASRYDPANYAAASTPNIGATSRPAPIVNNSSKANGMPPSSYEAPPNLAGGPEQRNHLHPRSGSIHRTGRAMRNRSPSLNDPYRRSEPVFVDSASYSDPRERERDYERPGYREDAHRSSMYEPGSSIPGRDRGRYRYDGGGSISSGVGVPGPPPGTYHHPSNAGREFYPSDDERYRQGSIRPLGATPGVNYDYGSSPSGYYR